LFDALKGTDRAKANVLFAAAGRSGFDASISLVTHWQNGSAEPSGGYGYGGRGYRRGYEDYGDDFDDGDHEMGEVFDESLSAERFSGADGTPLAFGRIPLEESEIVSEDPLAEGEPDEEDFEGYTGNAGMTLERWYHRAAVMLWPEESRFDVLCEAGMKAAVGGLEQMVKQWKGATGSEAAAIKGRCVEFADRIIAHWPEQEFDSGSRGSGYAYGEPDDFDGDYDTGSEDEHDDTDDVAFYQIDGDQTGDEKTGTSKVSLLSLLAGLDDSSLVARWISKVLAKDATVDPGKELLAICRRHGWLTFQDDLLLLFESSTNETIERNARLLADWSLCRDRSAERGRLCAILAQCIMAALERWIERPEKHDWRAKKVDRSALLLTLSKTIIALGDMELFERLTTSLCDQPKRFDLTTVQIPALLHMNTWLERYLKQPCEPLHRWLRGVVEELESRVSHPPQAPADWRREAATGCSCADCRQLSQFLRDPSKETLRLPLAKERRQHLHQVIDRKGLDTTHVTERSGRPFTLVCTKTSATYDRALKAHQVDLDHLAAMRKLHNRLDRLQKRQA
jgi:hypothetical protein